MEAINDEKNNAEIELIALYRRTGDIDVVAQLYKPYMALVYGVCLKYLKDRQESQDAVMHIFEKLVGALKKHEVTYFRSWLYTMAKNYCLMQLRSRKGRYFQEISPNLMESDGELHHEPGQEIEANLGKLEKCIEELSAEQKQCVQLFYLQQKCYKEISALTGYDGNKVKSYIQNGKRNLKICIERNGG